MQVHIIIIYVAMFGILYIRSYCIPLLVEKFQRVYHQGTLVDNQSLSFPSVVYQHKPANTFSVITRA